MATAEPPGKVQSVTEGNGGKEGVANGVVSMATTGQDAEEGKDGLCGWGPVKPTYLQIFRSPKVFLFWLCWAGALQGLVVNGFVSVVISTIERRFDLGSTESGLIASSYDIAAVLCLIPVSYFGGIGCKPRWLGLGLMILGTGSILFSLPHFMTGLYEYERSREHKCYIEDNSTTICNEEDKSSSLSNYKYALIFGQLLHGTGASPLYTLGVTYLDENLKAKMTPLYVSIFYTMAIVGPAIGYVMGGEFLKIYTDVDSVNVTLLDIEPDSPKWVGAWWIGFLISGSLAILISFPILAFPRSLPGSAELRSQRVSETYYRDKEATKPMLGSSKLNEGRVSETYKGDTPQSDSFLIRDIPKSLKVLITNPTFMFLNLAGASEGLLLSGFTVFTPKFIESQFSISAGWAAQLVGFATIPAGGGGTFLGGYLVKRFDLRCRGILRLCLTATSISLMLTLIFLVQCSPVKFAGVNTDYILSNVSLLESNLTAECNAGCQCHRDRYDPVCGVNQVMYFSPCHAGCTQSDDYNTMYKNCMCIQNALPPAFNGSIQANKGRCESSCNLLALFLPLFAFTIMATFTASMPALSATLRCVPDNHRSFALGIQWIIVRCLGTIPAPILFGAVIDYTCSLWQKTCAGEGSCYSYNNRHMGRYLMALAIAGKTLSICCFICAATLYRPPPQPPSGDTNGNALTEVDKSNMNSKHNTVTPASENMHEEKAVEVTKL